MVVLQDQTDLFPLILDSPDEDAQVEHRRLWEQDLDLMGAAVPGPDAVKEILRSSFGTTAM